MTALIPALVVGGGISGLACAYALRKRGIAAQLLEATERTGGVIRSERRDGFLLEFGPQSFAGTPTLRGLCFDLGIGSDLIQAPRKAPRYISIGGALQRVPLNPFSLLTSSLLSANTKWTIARDAFAKTQPPDQDESVADFVRRKFTNELLDRLVGPFVSGIYAGDPEKLSLRATFPQLYEAEKSAGSVIRGLLVRGKSGNQRRDRPALLSFRKGNDTLVRALEAKLGAALCLGTEVTAIQLRSEGNARNFLVTVRRDNQRQSILAERVILATPADVTGRLLGQMSSEIEPLLTSIPYAPVAVVSLSYRRGDVGRPLNGFGFLVPRSEGLRVLGTVWNSSLFPGRAQQGYVLLTSFLGGATDPQAVSLSQENLVALVHREIGPLLSIREKPLMSSVQVHERALPQFNLGHTERLAAIEKLALAIPNLRLIGNYLRGPSVGACVDQALAAAAAI